MFNGHSIILYTKAKDAYRSIKKNGGRITLKNQAHVHEFPLLNFDKNLEAKMVVLTTQDRKQQLLEAWFVYHKIIVYIRLNLIGLNEELND